jgi:hypothetical protein
MFNNRWEYSYLDSKAIIDGTVEAGELVHGDLSWKTILLPAVSTLPVEAWERLVQFVESGGLLISLELLPENSENSFPDRVIQARFKALFESHENAIFVAGWTPEILQELLSERLEKAVQLEDESTPIRIAHKNIEGKELFYLINDSEETLSTNVTFATRGKLEEWDPASGEIHTISNTSQIELLPYHGKIYRSR